VDTIATNPNQADDPVADPAPADSQTLLTAADAVSVRLDGLRGRQLDIATHTRALHDHQETDDGRDGDGIKHGAAAPDVADGSHDTGDRNRR